MREATTAEIDLSAARAADALIGTPLGDEVVAYAARTPETGAIDIVTVGAAAVAVEPNEAMVALEELHRRHLESRDWSFVEFCAALENAVYQPVVRVRTDDGHDAVFLPGLNGAS